MPRYDKSLRGGRGDRAPLEAWPKVQGPLQVTSKTKHKEAVRVT